MKQKFKHIIISILMSSAITTFLLSSLSKEYYHFGRSMHIEGFKEAIATFILNFVIVYVLIPKNKQPNVPRCEDKDDANNK